MQALVRKFDHIEDSIMIRGRGRPSKTQTTKRDDVDH